MDILHKDATFVAQHPHSATNGAPAHHANGTADAPARWPLPKAEEKLLIQCLAASDGAGGVFSRLQSDQLSDEWAQRFFKAANGLHATGATITHESLADACKALADAADTGSEADAWSYAADVARSGELELPRNFGGKLPGEAALKIADKIAREAAPAFEVFTFADLARLPRPQWLIRGLLVEKTTSVLSADSGSFKSFLALDMALSIATGRAFHGREVSPGPVVYVAAEGFFTMWERATAWAQFYGVELPQNFHILKAPVNVSDAAQVQKFVTHFKELAPIFAVLDTLSQCATGLNENSNDEMARFMGGMMATGAALGAHIQAVHHNAKASGNFRGAGAIKANVDTHISLDRPEGDENNTVFVRCEKQRGRPFEAFTLRGHEITLPFCDEFGDELTSLVFELCGDAVAPKAAKHPNAARADKTRAALLEVFDAVADEGAKFGGVKVGFWKEAVEVADPPICEERTFWKYRKALENDGTIQNCGNHNGSPLFCRVAPVITTTATTATTAFAVNAVPPNTDCNNCNNPLGVAVSAVGVAVAEDAAKKPRAKKPKNHAASEPYPMPHEVTLGELEAAGSEGGAATRKRVSL